MAVSISDVYIIPDIGTPPPKCGKFYKFVPSISL
jgi:hypothetical protein